MTGFLAKSSANGSSFRTAGAREIQAQDEVSGLHLSSRLQLLFLVTPRDLELNEIAFHTFISEVCMLSGDEQSTIPGINGKFLHLCLRHPPRLSANNQLLRTYVAIMLLKLWSSDQTSSITVRFRVSRGWMQNAIQSSSAKPVV
ncbi:hypothetical protein M3Y95_01043800 [Aphelenchoides besseyi]|nr:hypothetical protein M3Y95_01043800 [Aphelenchoides besseyi]